MTTPNLIAQLRMVHQLTNTEIQVARTRTAQARTEAVRRELTQNAANGVDRADAIEAVIRDLGGLPQIVGPLVGRTLALVKTIGEQAQPFDEALLGDLALEHQLLGRSKYIKALATAADEKPSIALAQRLITAHSATVEWLETLLAEEALGGPVALRRTPLQAAAGGAVQLANIPATWSARSLDRVLDAARATPKHLESLLGRGAHAGQIAAKTLGASRDAALEAAEDVTREEGADVFADALHATRAASGALHADELPIDDYSSLNVSDAVAAIKELDQSSDIRVVLQYEEANKNRHGVVSAAQTRLAGIAKEVISIG